ncbi:hypothetical protein TWF696_002480 [Orbilia brochopaga]|uniref:Uncharacterized protein n=1 Tax=Orbilia brochopaga TaxID=3140254 RepID=A0AAV9U2U5_9PEZI
MDSSGTRSERSPSPDTPSPHPPYSPLSTASDSSTSTLSSSDPTEGMAPYNLSRYASYPRRATPSKSLSSSVANTEETPAPPPKKTTISPQSAKRLQEIAAAALALMPEDDDDGGHTPLAPDWGIGPGTGTYDARPAIMNLSTASSVSSFKTAPEKNPDKVLMNAKLKKRASNSGMSIPNTALVLHSDPDDCYPTDSYAPSSMVINLPEPVTVKTAYKTRIATVKSTMPSLTTSGPPNTPQEQQPPPPQKPPTMFLFVIQASRTNRQLNQCEYVIRYKSSRGNPNFPNCIARESVFLFDALCKHKAIVDRLRLWHRQNLFKPKDMRVDSHEYYMSYHERLQLRDWNWPGYISKEWSRCLIWDDDDFPPDEEAGI